MDKLDKFLGEKNHFSNDVSISIYSLCIYAYGIC